MSKIFAVLLGLFLACVSIAPALASDNGNDHKVTICHRTNSETNPYVVNTVDKASVVGGHVDVAEGHDGHTGPVFSEGLKATHTKWGDIIPAFDYVVEGKKKGDPDTTGHYNGLNASTGASILANGCVVPSTPTPTESVTPTDTPTVTPTITPTPTDTSCTNLSMPTGGNCDNVTPTPTKTEKPREVPGTHKPTPHKTKHPVTHSTPKPTKPTVKELPHTGFNAGVIGLIALGLIGTGTGLFFGLRKLT